MTVTDKRTEGINSICVQCINLGKTCQGTKNPVWTGCVHRQTVKRDILGRIITPQNKEETL